MSRRRVLFVMLICFIFFNLCDLFANDQGILDQAKSYIQSANQLLSHDDSSPDDLKEMIRNINLATASVTSLKEINSDDIVGQMQRLFYQLNLRLDQIIDAQKRTSDILIINSDNRIKKYMISQDSYEKSMDRYLPVINLNEFDAPIEDHIKYIYCIGSKAIKKAQKKNDVSLFFSSALNWKRLGLSDRFYGVSNELDVAMQVMMFKYFFPEIKTIGVIYTPEYNAEWVEELKVVSKALGISIVAKKAMGSFLSKKTIQKVMDQSEFFWVISDPAVMNSDSINLIFKVAKKLNKAVVGNNDALLKLGAIFSISADQATIGRQVSMLTKRVISEESISQRVEFPMGTFISIHLSHIYDLGINYNKDALGAANLIIE